MDITDIRIRLIKTGRLKASASVTFENELVVHDIKVIENEGKRFLAMPSKKLADGKYMDIAHPVNKSAREKLEAEVMERYRAALEEADAPAAEEQ